MVALLKIDLHIHTSVASPCSVLSIEQLFKAAKVRGLDGVCITDHSSYDGFLKVKRAAAEMMPCLKVFFGVEIQTTGGDMLVYSLHKLPDSVLNSVPEPQYLIDCAHEYEGLAVAAHPFRRNAPSLGSMLQDLKGLDGIEVQNGNCDDHINAMALEASSQFNLFPTSSSDAHCVASVGSYFSVFNVPVETQAELLAALFQRKVQPSGNGLPLRGIR